MGPDCCALRIPVLVHVDVARTINAADELLHRGLRPASEGLEVGEGLERIMGTRITLKSGRVFLRFLRIREHVDSPATP